MSEIETIKHCKDCKYYIHYHKLKDDECANPGGAKFNLGISEFDSCPMWEKSKYA